jgi:hypothetical protein
VADPVEPPTGPARVSGWGFPHRETPTRSIEPAAAVRHDDGMESVLAAVIEILLDPAVLVGAVVASFVLLSGLAARVVELAEGHGPGVGRRPTSRGPVTGVRARDVARR